MCCNMCVVLLSIKRDFVRERERKKGGDVFMSSKMMLFQNNGVWEKMSNG